ncbi:hypothetical protein NL676_034566 [Syzygium grande]|nr:hypothetical protein NL676_034566 [Syzygium grande]
MAPSQKLHYFCGMMEFVPPPQPPAKRSNKRHLITDCAEVEWTTGSSSYDGFSGCTTQFDEMFMAEEFGDRTEGCSGFKEEVKCKSTAKYVRPRQPPAKRSYKRHLITDCAKVERTTRSSYCDEFSGLTTQFDKKRKTEKFVDRTTGRSGCKEVVKYKSTVKVDDRRSGCTDKYTTLVEVKRVTSKPTAKAAPKSKKKCVCYY